MGVACCSSAPPGVCLASSAAHPFFRLCLHVGRVYVSSLLAAVAFASVLRRGRGCLTDLAPVSPCASVLGISVVRLSVKLHLSCDNLVSGSMSCAAHLV